MDRGAISTCQETVKSCRSINFVFKVATGLYMYIKLYKFLATLDAVAIGQNQPLVHEQEEWTSDVPLTEGQLRGKRDTFWETAPVYEGRKEIWDALRAACEAVEDGDFELAQAIVDGVSLCLPRGQGNTITQCCVHVVIGFTVILIIV